MSRVRSWPKPPRTHARPFIAAIVLSSTGLCACETYSDLPRVVEHYAHAVHIMVPAGHLGSLPLDDKGELQCRRAHLGAAPLRVALEGLWRYAPERAERWVNGAKTVDGVWRAVPLVKGATAVLPRDVQQVSLAPLLARPLEHGLFFVVARVNGRRECSEVYNSSTMCCRTAPPTPPGMIWACLPGHGSSFIPDPKSSLRVGGKNVGALCQKSGFLRTRETEVRGEPHGLTYVYSESGALEKVIPYHRGRIHGVVRTFDPQGRLAAEEPYAQGRRHGTAKHYYPRGELLRVMRFARGVQAGTSMELYPDGRVSAIEILVDGCPALRTDFDENGHVVRLMTAVCSSGGQGLQEIPFRR